ncbi:hypothetical protein HDV05_002431 [Chytridiales sp. JEL 0842]|nr:hypothetical protein HDV05_002431 [Chytridiales sp. JEL 0842]
MGRVVLTPEFDQDPFAASLNIWLLSNRKAAPNGSLMRTAPIGVICISKILEETFRTAAEISRITHVDPRYNTQNNPPNLLEGVDQPSMNTHPLQEPLIAPAAEPAAFIYNVPSSSSFSKSLLNDRPHTLPASGASGSLEFVLDEPAAAPPKGVIKFAEHSNTKNNGSDGNHLLAKLETKSITSQPPPHFILENLDEDPWNPSPTAPPPQRTERSRPSSFSLSNILPSSTPPLFNRLSNSWSSILPSINFKPSKPRPSILHDSLLTDSPFSSQTHTHLSELSAITQDNTTTTQPSIYSTTASLYENSDEEEEDEEISRGRREETLPFLRSRVLERSITPTPDNARPADQGEFRRRHSQSENEETLDPKTPVLLALSILGSLLSVCCICVLPLCLTSVYYSAQIDALHLRSEHERAKKYLNYSKVLVVITFVGIALGTVVGFIVLSEVLSP